MCGFVAFFVDFGMFLNGLCVGRCTYWVDVCTYDV